MQKMGHSREEKAKKPRKDGEATQKLTTAESQHPSRASGHRGVMVLPKLGSQDHPAKARTTAEATQQKVRPWREGCPAGIWNSHADGAGPETPSSAQRRERRGNVLTSPFFPSSNLLSNQDRNQWQEAWETQLAGERQGWIGKHKTMTSPGTREQTHPSCTLMMEKQGA